VASFSRALLAGLSARQTEEEFNAMLNGSIESIFEASTTKQVSDQRTARIA
jgi:fructose-bisphosphate aldolase class I